MKKQLFFDDFYLFAKDNIIRKYGKPELISTYIDPICSTDFCTGNVFKLDNGKYRMLYFAHSKEFSGKKLFSAISDDGINFQPEKICNPETDTDKMYSHEIMSLKNGEEVAYIFQDTHCEDAKERYKLLMTEFCYEKLWVENVLYVSEDLLNWKLKPNSCWGEGGEPLTGVFYNKHKQVYTVVQRPFWGVRSVGYKETKDWENYSEYNYCLNTDPLDEGLSEIYGMFPFEFDGMYIGIQHMYRHLKSELSAKYKGGIIDTQLSYSYDGRYWQRSVREPFITGVTDINKNYARHNMVWVPCMIKGNDENIYFYGSATEEEHGTAFDNLGKGKIFIYKLRKDGFVSLASDNIDNLASVATREKVWNSGDIHLNIKAEKATVAVYVTDESETVMGNNLGIARPIEGFTHEDCIEFSGESFDWTPKFKNGKTLDDLRGKTLVFEINFKNGELFSLWGDYIDLFNTQAARYRKFKALPE